MRFNPYSDAKEDALQDVGSNRFCNDVAFSPANPVNGEKLTLKCKTGEIAITANGTTTHDEADWIPANAMVIACTARVITTIGGASGNLSLGPDGAATAWCNAKASKLTAGAVINSYTEGAATGPTIVAAADVLRFTSGTGNFNGTGVVRVTIWYYELTTPTS